MKQFLKKTLSIIFVVFLAFVFCASAKPQTNIPVKFTWKDGKSVVDTDAYRRDVTYVFYRAETDDKGSAVAFDGNTLTLEKADFAGEDEWSGTFSADEGYFYFLHSIVDQSGNELAIPSYEISNIGLETTTATLITNGGLSYDYDFRLRAMDDYDPLTVNYPESGNSNRYDMNVHSYKKIIQINQQYKVICDAIYFVPYRMDGENFVYLEDPEGIAVPGLPEGKTYTASRVTLLDDATDLDLLDDAGFSGFSKPSCLIASYINNNYSPVDLVSFDLPSMPKVSPSGNEYADGLLMVVTYPNGKVTQKVISASVTDHSDVYYRYMDYISEDESPWGFEAELFDAVETNNNGILEFRIGRTNAFGRSNYGIYLAWDDGNNKDRTRPEGWEDIPLQKMYLKNDPEVTFDYKDMAFFSCYECPKEYVDLLAEVSGVSVFFDPMHLRFRHYESIKDWYPDAPSDGWISSNSIYCEGLLEEDLDDRYELWDFTTYVIPALCECQWYPLSMPERDAQEQTNGLNAWVKTVGFDVAVPEGYVRAKEDKPIYIDLAWDYGYWYIGSVGTLYCEVTDETRKAHDLSVTVNYEDIAELASLTRPELELTLQYYDPINKVWVSLNDDTMSGFVKVTEENPSTPTQTVTFENGDTSATVTWNSMVENWWDTDAIGTQIEYRAVLNVVSNECGYTIVVGQDNVVEISEEDFIGAFTCTYEIPETQPMLKKLWADEYNNGYTLEEIESMIGDDLLPETVKMQLYYRAAGTEEWNEIGQAEEFSVLAIAENAAAWHTVLPQKDYLGNTLEYRFLETSAKYQSDASYVDIEQDSDGVYSDGKKVIYNPTVAFTTENLNAVASNTKPGVKKTVTLVHQWADNNNENNARPTNLYYTIMYRVDGTSNWNAVTKETVDAYGRYVAAGIHTTSDATQAVATDNNEITIVWENLPEKFDGVLLYYKAVLTDENGVEVNNVESYEFTTDTSDGVVPGGEEQTFVFTYNNGEEEDPGHNPHHNPHGVNPIGCLVSHVLCSLSRVVYTVSSIIRWLF